MRDTLVLVVRNLRESLRRPATRRLMILALALLLTVLVGLGHDARGPSTVVGASLLLVGVVAFVAASAAGALLPRDRATGRATWLRTLAPPDSTHRLAAALAGIGLAVALALAGATVIALIVPRLVGSAAVRTTRPLVLEGSQRLAPVERGASPWRLALPASADGETAEVVFAPPYALADAPFVVPRVAWRIGGAHGEADLAYGRPLRVGVPAGDAGTVLEIRNLTPRTWLFVRDARLLGSRASFLATLLVAGLLLGLAAGALAPVAVLLSRFTSAATAVLAGLVLGLAGVLAPLLGSPTGPTGGWSEAWGARVLHAAGALAPDFSGLAVLGEPGAGHALEVTAFLPLLAPLGYALVALLLVALPVPRAWRREEAP